MKIAYSVQPYLQVHELKSRVHELSSTVHELSVTGNDLSVCMSGYGIHLRFMGSFLILKFRSV